MATKNVTDGNFDTEVIKSTKLILVDFWAEWCGPCKQLAPKIDNIAKHYNEKVLVGKVNVEHFAPLAAEYKVRGIPNLLIFNNGKVFQSLVGNVPENDITEILDRMIG